MSRHEHKVKGYTIDSSNLEEHDNGNTTNFHGGVTVSHPDGSKKHFEAHGNDRGINVRDSVMDHIQRHSGNKLSEDEYVGGVEGMRGKRKLIKSNRTVGDMKKLLKLEAKLRKAKEELKKGLVTTAAAPPSDDDSKKPKKGHSSFTMGHINDVAGTKDHREAKAKAHAAVDSSNANDKNRKKMKLMIDSSKSPSHLAQGMTNHLLAHPGEGLKVVKSLLGDMNPIEKMDGMDAGAASAPDVNTTMSKEEDDEDEEKKDKKKDKKIAQKEVDKHNERKHGEPKDVDSAMKADGIPKGITDQPTGEIIDDWEKPKPMEKGARKLDFSEARDKTETRMATPQESTEAADRAGLSRMITPKEKEQIAEAKAKSSVAKACGEIIKFEKNGQWSITKADMGARPNGEFDVPVTEVYDGEDQFTHIGNRGVDGDDKGKTQKLSDKEKALLKD